MWAVPTCSVVIQDGSESDEWGDEVDNIDFSSEPILASIIENRQLVTTPADGRVQTVRQFTGRLPREYAGDVIPGSRLYDQANGRVFVVDAVTSVDNPYLDQDVRLDLRRIT